MTEQTSLWQKEQQSIDFAELCTALYERELGLLAKMSISSAPALQARLKSLPYYVKRTAHLMLKTQTPLVLDVQNATWSAKQGKHMPLNDQEFESVNKWYLSAHLTHGLVVPIACESYIALDSIDRIDKDNHRFRTNAHGWFSLQNLNKRLDTQDQIKLLKPNKRVMTAACSGHSWLNDHKTNPVIPSLRELLLSCAINWRNFKRPVIF